MPNKARAMADPTRLKPIDKKDGSVQVIIETPKGSRNKFAFDPEQNIFALKKVLPAGMAFPYEFGFLPRTRAEDGDPIDVLLLMDEPAFPGCSVRARLIGVIEGEQLEGKKKFATTGCSPSLKPIICTPIFAALKTCPRNSCMSSRTSL